MPRTEDEEIEGRKSKTDAQGMGAGVGQLPLIKLTELLRQPGLACNNPPLLH